MPDEVRRYRKQNCKNVRLRFSKCQNCFFSYISEDKESLLCMGNISQGESIPDWFVKANVNENRIMTNEEILLRLNEFKKM